MADTTTLRERFEAWARAHNWQDEAIERWRAGERCALNGLFTLFSAGFEAAHKEAHILVEALERIGTRIVGSTAIHPYIKEEIAVEIDKAIKKYREGSKDGDGVKGGSDA